MWVLFDKTSNFNRLRWQYGGNCEHCQPRLDFKPLTVCCGLLKGTDVGVGMYGGLVWGVWYGREVLRLGMVLNWGVCIGYLVLRFVIGGSHVGLVSASRVWGGQHGQRQRKAGDRDHPRQRPAGNGDPTCRTKGRTGDCPGPAEMSRRGQWAPLQCSLPSMSAHRHLLKTTGQGRQRSQCAPTSSSPSKHWCLLTSCALLAMANCALCKAHLPSSKDMVEKPRAAPYSMRIHCPSVLCISTQGK